MESAMISPALHISCASLSHRTCLRPSVESTQIAGQNEFVALGVQSSVAAARRESHLSVGKEQFYGRYRSWRNRRSTPSSSCFSTSLRAAASGVSAEPTAECENLLNELLQLTEGISMGVTAGEEERERVGEIARELEAFCIDRPLESSLIFGDWDVVYTSNQTSTGGLFRSAIGRFLLKTKDLTQGIILPDGVKNFVSFDALGVIPGWVSLPGRLTVLDEKWIRVEFERPTLCLGSYEIKFGGESSVQLKVVFLSESIRVGIGGSGTIIVFRRRPAH